MAQLKLPVEVTNNSTTVIVPNENLVGQVFAGQIFMVHGELTPYFLASDPTYSSLNAETTVVLTGAYQGATNLAANGVFVVDFTTPDEIPLIAAGDVNTATIFSQAMQVIQTILNRERHFQSVTATGATTGLDMSQSGNFHVTLQANTTFVISNVPTQTPQMIVMRVILRQDATGGRTPTFPASVKFENNNATPAWTTTANRADGVLLISFDNGTNWLAKREFTNLP
jgi:hypothetical protein